MVICFISGLYGFIWLVQLAFRVIVDETAGSDSGRGYGLT
jgi:hypothetical protein